MGPMSMVGVWRTAAECARGLLLRGGVWTRLVIPLSLSALVVLGAADFVWARRYPPPNLALKAVVSASSAGFRTSAQGAADGYRYGQLGFHSREQVSPWLAFDLGGSHVINRVDTYGRGDCCFDMSIPLGLEASDDGVTYRLIATRKTPFSQVKPWIVRPKGLTARYLRLRGLREGRSLLVLSEVEVYGEPSEEVASRDARAFK
jgi:F5/8 type C domain